MSQVRSPVTRPRHAGGPAGLAAVALALAAAHAPAGSLAGAKGALRERALRDPLGALGTVVLGGGYAFWLAERGRNPSVRSLWDALVFVSTCLSVGYHNVFAVTPAGKAIATFVMTYGPALAAVGLDPTMQERDREAAERAEAHAAILARLDGILAALRKEPG